MNKKRTTSGQTEEEKRLAELRNLNLDHCITCTNFHGFDPDTGPLTAFILCGIGGKEGGTTANIFATRARSCKHPVPRK